MNRYSNSINSSVDKATGIVKRRNFIHRSVLWLYRRLPDIILYGYTFLYMYTGWDKFKNMEAFIRGVKKIPYLGHYATMIGWSIPALEILLAALLVIPIRKVQRGTLLASTVLMGLFTLYLGMMLLFVPDRLCHCGGVIESMGWKTHIAFNIFWLIVGTYALNKINIIKTKIH